MVAVLNVFLAVPIEQHKQLRLRLDPVTLARANDIQELLKAGDKNSSLEAVIGMAIEELHQSMLPGNA